MGLRVAQLLLVLALLQSVAYAGYGGGGSSGGGGGTSYGLSNISINTSAISVPAGGAATVFFNITLYSGTSYTTTLNIVNGAQLLYSYGIGLSGNPPSGNPTFSGIVKITVSNSTPPGVYKALLGASGGDPSNNAILLNIDVFSPTATVPSTIANTATSTVPPQTINTSTTIRTIPVYPGGLGPRTTIPSNSPGTAPQKPNFDFIALLVGAILLAIWAAFKLKKWKWTPDKLPWPLG